MGESPRFQIDSKEVMTANVRRELWNEQLQHQSETATAWTSRILPSNVPCTLARRIVEIYNLASSWGEIVKKSMTQDLDGYWV